jgi:hypothetical protein
MKVTDREKEATNWHSRNPGAEVRHKTAILHQRVWQNRMFEQHCGIEDSVAGLDRKILGTLGKSSNLLGLCEPPPQARDDLEKHHAGIVPSLDRFPITRKRFELSQG